MNSAKDICGPCLTEKQIKKQREQDLKEIKTTINFLVKNIGYEKDTMAVIGTLTAQMIRLQGPLK